MHIQQSNYLTINLVLNENIPKLWTILSKISSHSSILKKTAKSLYNPVNFIVYMKQIIPHISTLLGSW